MKFRAALRYEDSQVIHYISRDDEGPEERVFLGSDPTRWLIWYSTESEPDSNPQADVPHNYLDIFQILNDFDNPREYKNILRIPTNVSAKHMAYVDKCVKQFNTRNYPPLITEFKTPGMIGGLWPEPRWNEQVQPSLKAGARLWSYRL